MTFMTGALCQADDFSLKLKENEIRTAQRQFLRAAEVFDEAASADKRATALIWARAAGAYVATVMDLYEEQREEQGEGEALGETGMRLRTALGLLRALQLPNAVDKVYYSQKNSPYALRLQSIARFSVATLAATTVALLTGHWATQDPNTLRLTVFASVLAVSAAVPLIPIVKFVVHYFKISPEQKQLEEELARATLEGLASTDYSYVIPDGITAVQALRELQTNIVGVTTESCALNLVADPR